jgi:hypothetical protein
MIEIDRKATPYLGRLQFEAAFGHQRAVLHGGFRPSETVIYRGQKIALKAAPVTVLTPDTTSHALHIARR